MNPVINTASILCIDQEKAGFAKGVNVGILLARETEQMNKSEQGSEKFAP